MSDETREEAFRLLFAHRYELGDAKRYDMIALLLQAVPQAHHNYAKRIITPNSPQAIIT